jgi:hypothetical protein
MDFALSGAAFALGPIRFEPYPIVVHDTAGVGSELGFQVGGLVGANPLKRYRMSFDLLRPPPSAARG